MIDRPTPRSYRRAALALVATSAVSAIGLWGCGDPSSVGGLYRVSGTVTKHREPLARGSIAFQPLVANGRGAVTMIQDGQYHLPAAEGLPEGRFAVEIREASDPSALPPGVMIDEATGAEVSVAKRAGSTNRGKSRNSAPKPGPALSRQARTIEVTKDGPNTFDLDLTD
jgi:hypothetical protein